MQKRLLPIFRHSLNKLIMSELDFATSGVHIILIHTLLDSRSIALPRSFEDSTPTRLNALLQRFRSLLRILLFLRGFGLLRRRLVVLAFFGLAAFC